MEPIDLTDPEKLFDIVTEYEERIAALEAMVSSLRINQQTQPAICQQCGGTGRPGLQLRFGESCQACGGTGKQQAGA
jgi:DnaJ-class molecular chaperone